MISESDWTNERTNEDPIILGTAAAAAAAGAPSAVVVGSLGPGVYSLLSSSS